MFSVSNVMLYGKALKFEFNKDARGIKIVGICQICLVRFGI